MLCLPLCIVRQLTFCICHRSLSPLTKPCHLSAYPVNSPSVTVPCHLSPNNVTCQLTLSFRNARLASVSRIFFKTFLKTPSSLLFWRIGFIISYIFLLVAAGCRFIMHQLVFKTYVGNCFGHQNGKKIRSTKAEFKT